MRFTSATIDLLQLRHLKHHLQTPLSYLAAGMLIHLKHLVVVN